jgi:hypothetical protein
MAKVRRRATWAASDSVMKQDPQKGAGLSQGGRRKSTHA